MDFRHGIHSFERRSAGPKTRCDKDFPAEPCSTLWTSIRLPVISGKYPNMALLRWICAIRRHKRNSDAMFSVATSTVCNRLFGCCIHEQNATESSLQRRSRAKKKFGFVAPGVTKTRRSRSCGRARMKNDEPPPTSIPHVLIVDRRHQRGKKNDGRISGRRSFAARRAQ